MSVHFACKLCILEKGLKGSEIDSLPTTEEELFEHLRTVHGIDVRSESMKRRIRAQSDVRIFNAELTEARPCPGCGSTLDAATLASEDLDGRARVPELGDATICAYCSAVLILTEVGWRLATQEEFDALPQMTKDLAKGWKPFPHR